jgi:hypothetical protein
MYTVVKPIIQILLYRKSSSPTFLDGSLFKEVKIPIPKTIITKPHSNCRVTSRNYPHQLYGNF